MKPYYEDEAVTIYHADCRDVLPTLDKVDLVLTDPPFFMPATHYQSRKNWQRSWADTSILSAFWDVILDAVNLNPVGHFITFCNAASYPVFYPSMYRRFDYLKSIVWDKGHVGLGRIWRNQHELIIAARWNDSIFNDDGRLRADVLRFNATPSALREHPVEKPTGLLSALIQPTTYERGTVLDPFCGSGTTLRAAKDLNRKAIGVEAEERYCEIAAKRMGQLAMEL